MIHVSKSAKFLRSYKRLIKGRADLQKEFSEKIVIFMANPYDPSLGTHKLKGKLRHSWGFSLTHGLRVVFMFVDDHTVILEDIGTHDDVYY